MPSERSISQTHCSPPRNNLRILMRCRPTRTDTNFACSSHAEFQSVPMFRTSQSGERSSMSQLPLIQCTLIYYTKTFECQNQPSCVSKSACLSGLLFLPSQDFSYFVVEHVVRYATIERPLAVQCGQWQRVSSFDLLADLVDLRVAVLDDVDEPELSLI